MGTFLQPYLFSLRIGSFFTHFLYYIPFIYFFSNPLKRLFHIKIKRTVAESSHHFFENYVNKYRVLISTFAIVVITIVTIFSSLRYYYNHEKYVAPRMNVVHERFRELVSVSGENGTLISEDIAVNLLSSVLSKNTSLLVNTFNNYVSNEEILNRLVLFAKIYNWDEDRFLNFMMPDEAYKDIHKKNNSVF